ncbi:MAG: cohesin domain-containing protein [Bacteroidota bacterium]
MSKLLLRSLGILPLLLALPMQAQITTFYLAETDASHGEVVDISLSVAEFKAVAAAQLSISWNPEQLEFLEVNDLALGATQDGNFNLRRSDAGILAYSFIDPTLVGYELQDGTSLYNLRFKVLARAGETVQIEFSENPTRCVVGNPQGTEKAAQFVGGRIRVVDGGLNNPPAEVQLQIQPNPFSQRAQVVIDMPEAMGVDLNIYDLEGRLVHSKTLDLDSGRNQVLVEATDLPAAGTYLVEISGESLRLNRKFVFSGRR